jgi:hypothetical protein
MRVRHNGRDEEVAVPPHSDQRATGRDAAGGFDGHPVVAARCQSRGLAGGVDAAQLHRHRGNAGQAQHQHDDQRRDAQSRLDGARAGTLADIAG